MSEEELLLLSNYAYMDASTDPMTIRESLDRFRNKNGGFDEDSVASAGIGGGLDRKQTADLFTRMDRMPDSFLDLYPSRIVNEPQLRGICYSAGKADGGTGTVVFRGTGGTYDAWHDNVIGECVPSTEIQKQAADFIRYDCMGFSDLTVTGHSKGGNLAMFTTVACASSVAACVAFDGQGFSHAFLKDYRQEIAAAAGKIKSISAHNDFVNILLHPIAGERVFAQNPAGGIDAHSSYHLLAGNDFDEAGNLITTRGQSLPAWALSEALSEITDVMDILPGNGNREISALLAAYVASVMSEDKGEAYEHTMIDAATGSVGMYLLGLIPQLRIPEVSQVRIHTPQKELQTDGMREAAEDLALFCGRIRRVQNGLCDLTAGMDPSERIGYYTNLQLASLGAQMEEEAASMELCAEALHRIRGLYEVQERDLSARIAAVI